MASLDAPMVVVTTAVAGERAGCLVGFHAQSAIDPQRYCLWLSKANHTYRVALRSTYLAVHFLTADDLDLAEHFGTRTGEDDDKFVDLATQDGPDGVPLLDAPAPPDDRPSGRAARRGRRPRLPLRGVRRRGDLRPLRAVAALAASTT